MAPLSGICEARLPLNGTFKAELIAHHDPWRNLTHVKHELPRWVGWYNHTRLHSKLGHVPPAEYGATHYPAIATEKAA